MTSTDFDTIAAAQTLLFVPGDRPDRFAKAVASGADDIVLDLEDAVASDRKIAARTEVRRWLEAGGRGVVRINPAESPWYDDDVHALQGLRCAVMLPKTSSGDQVRALLARLPDGSFVLPLLETATGILSAAPICATPGVVRAAFGNGDLSVELCLDPTNQVGLAAARSAVVLASAASHIAQPLDGVTIAYNNDQALLDDIQHALDLGFGGKLCIHPRQVPPVREAFIPSAEQIQWARNVVEAGRSGAVTTVDNTMVDRPILIRARQLLARAERAHPSPVRANSA